MVCVRIYTDNDFKVKIRGERYDRFDEARA